MADTTHDVVITNNITFPIKLSIFTAPIAVPTAIPQKIKQTISLFLITPLPPSNLVSIIEDVVCADFC